MVCRSPKECDFSLQIVPLCDVVREEGIRSDAYTSTSKIVVFRQMNDEVSRLKFIIIQNGDEWHGFMETDITKKRCQKTPKLLLRCTFCIIEWHNTKC